MDRHGFRLGRAVLPGQPAVARIVAAPLYHGVALGHYDPRRFVAIANHGHILLLPKISLSHLLQSMMALPRAKRILGSH